VRIKRTLGRSSPLASRAQLDVTFVRLAKTGLARTFGGG
jgi:hypothetical protein